MKPEWNREGYVVRVLLFFRLPASCLRLNAQHSSSISWLHQSDFDVVRAHYCSWQLKGAASAVGAMNGANHDDTEQVSSRIRAIPKKEVTGLFRGFHSPLSFRRVAGEEFPADRPKTPNPKHFGSIISLADWGENMLPAKKDAQIDFINLCCYFQ